MEGTEHALGIEHLRGCLALSVSAGWNQNEADWRLMLSFGHGWGLAIPGGTLAASTMVLPYGDFAWISMVLVHPAHRRKGCATRLLRIALADLEKRGQTPILDATPAGRGVYAQEGFRDTWGFARFAFGGRSIQPGRERHCVREFEEKDWPQVLELDRRAFGGRRSAVLKDLARRLPQAALVAERAGKIAGFVFGRDGREACQLGPLIAEDGAIARFLLEEALRRVTPPVYVDIVDRDAALGAWLGSLGFAFQRPFTRMVRGARRAPGDESLVCCPAGPELG